MLCSNSEDLQKSCRNILRNASFILRDNIIAAVTKSIEDLKIVRNECFHALKDVPNDSFIDICERIKNETKILSPSIVQRQNSKYQRDNSSNINYDRQKRPLPSSKRRNHKTTGKGKQYIKQMKN